MPRSLHSALLALWCVAAVPAQDPSPPRIEPNSTQIVRLDAAGRVLLTARVLPGPSKGYFSVHAKSTATPLVLRITRSDGHVLCESDTDSGGANTPFFWGFFTAPLDLRIELRAPGEPPPSAPAEVEVHLRQTQETERSLAFAETLQQRFDAIGAQVRAGDRDAARRLLTELSDDLRAIPDHDQSEALWRGFIQLYNAARFLGANPVVEGALRAQLAFARRIFPETHTEVLGIQINLIQELEGKGSAEEMLPMAEHVHTTVESSLPADHPLQHFARMGLANTLRRLRRFAGVEALLRASIDAPPELQPAEPYLRFALRGNLATLFVAQDRFTEAIPLLRELHEAEPEFLRDDHPSRLSSLNNLGHCLVAIGDHEGALQTFEEVLAWREQHLPASHPEIGSVQRSLARTRLELGEPEAALELARRAVRQLDAAPGAGDGIRLGAREVLADVMAHLGDEAGAAELLAAVLERRIQVGSPPIDIARARNRLAGLLADRGEVEAALALERTALAEVELTYENRDVRNLRVSRLRIAQRLIRLGRTAEARAELARLRESLARVDDPLMIAAAETSEAMLLLEEGRSEAAVAAVTRARAVLRERTLPGSQADRASALALLRAHRQYGGAPDEAKAAAAQLVTACRAWQERYRLLQSPRTASGSARELLPSVDELLEFGLDPLAADDGAQPLLESICDLTESVDRAAWRALQRPGLQVGDEDTRRELREQLRLAEAGLNDLLLHPDTPAEALNEAVATRDQLGRALRAESDAAPETVTLPSGVWRLHLHRTVPPSEPGRTPRYVAILRRAERAPALLDLGAATDLERLARAWLGGLRDGSSTEPELGERLARRLLQPILALAGPELPSRLVWSGNGSLQGLPLAVLPWPDSGTAERLTDRVAMWRAPDLRTGVPDPVDARTAHLVAIGGVDFGTAKTAPNADTATRQPGDGEADALQGATARALRSSGLDGGERPAFDALPASDLEVAAVVAAWSAAGAEAPTLLRGADADLADFVAHAPEATVLHIATHGFVRLPEPRPSTLRFGLDRRQFTAQLSPLSVCGIALAGANEAEPWHAACISAAEISALDLSDCELAILSACDGSVGLRRAGLGLASLANGCHAAGARTVLAALWRVSDEATSELMTELHHRLLDGLPPQEALRAAQRHLRDARDADGEPRWSTGDWAGWVVSVAG